MTASLEAVSADRLTVVGSVHADNVFELRSRGEAMIRRAEGKLLYLDLSGAERASSVLLSLLLCWFRFAKSVNTELVIEGASDEILSLAALSGIEDLFAA